MNKHHQMHPLVFSLRKEGAYPSTIVAKVAKRLEMLHHPADHPRHRRNRLKHHGTVSVPLSKKCIRNPQGESHQPIGNRVTETVGFVVKEELVL